MSADRYLCCDERRRAALLDPAAPANLSGIDYIDVLAGATTALPTVIGTAPPLKTCGAESPP